MKQYLIYIFFLWFSDGSDNAAILGPGERVVRRGTTVTLTCHIKATKQMYQRPPRLVEWLFQDSPITSEVRVSLQDL